MPVKKILLWNELVPSYKLEQATKSLNPEWILTYHELNPWFEFDYVV